MKLKTFKIGGVHPPELKTAPSDHIITAPLPMEASVLLRQHIGAEAKPIVKVGDQVSRGQKIAQAPGAISANVHAPISGKVKTIAPVATLQGRPTNAIIIVATAEDHDADEKARAAAPVAKDCSNLTAKDITDAITEAGIVGMGGATFPTAVKLAPPPGSKAEILIINGCECEPRLTCDAALMRCHPDEVMTGIDLLRRGAQVDRAVIGIEDNKPNAVAAMTAAAKRYPGISIQVLRTKYPQGGEKQLIQAITGREVASGALPISVGAIVQNVATAYAAYQAIALGQPLIERVVTIDTVGNFLVAIGMKTSAISADIPQPTAEANPTVAAIDVVAGGPMMGQSVVNIDGPVTKGFSGLSFVNNPLQFEPAPCIRCAECVRACPMALEPYLISTYGRKGCPEEAKAIGALDCIECGSCNFSCPSARPILDYIRLAKMRIRALK
ncbi:MAG: electron transport complex subunit RsxC [Bacteroidales bacterium]|nr:electron transport complex subunit RsxC [Bacteroidales bacterium]